MYKRKNKLCKEVVFIDGMWGTGKAILAPVLGSFEKVEKQMINHTFEYICALNNYDKISNIDARSLIQVTADVLLFDSMISRNANFRPDDISGIFNNPYTFRSFKRLFKSGDDTITEEIISEKSMLQIMSHNILPISSLLFQTFGLGIKLVGMVRHPIYMAEHWYNYIERIGVDKREFTLAVGNEGKIPWFANSISEYLSLNKMDKVIYSMEALTKMQEESLKMYNNNIKDNIVLIPFESFVLDPMPWVRKITELLRTNTTDITIKVLKKQKCPRERINAGIGKKSYGWQKSSLKLSEKEDFERRMEFIKKESSSEAFILMENLSHQYEKKYDFPREMPWD